MVAASVFCSEKAQRSDSEEPSQPIKMTLEHNKALAQYVWQKYAQLIKFECDLLVSFQNHRLAPVVVSATSSRVKNLCSDPTECCGLRNIQKQSNPEASGVFSSVSIPNMFRSNGSMSVDVLLGNGQKNIW
jgi:hypothetical protein